MTDEPASPLTAFLSRLMSLGLGGQDLTDVVALAEAAFGSNTRSSISDDERRERGRLKKQRQRDRKRELSPGTVPTDPILSKTQKDSEKVKKKESGVPPVPGTPGDDWPEDYVEQFWKAFPPFRREARAKVAQKLARVRSQKVTWTILFGGVVKFAATNPGEYAPAPMRWLNEGRWDREYGTQQQGGSNGATQGAGGKVGFAGIAARLRERADDQLPLGQPAESPEPTGRR